MRAGERRVLEILRAESEDDVAADVLREPLVRGHGLVVEREAKALGDRLHAPVRALEPDLEHVHRRAADEPAHEQVDRPVVKLLGRSNLLQGPFCA